MNPCSTSASVKPSSNLDHGEDFSELNGSTSEWSGNVKKPRVSDGLKLTNNTENNVGQTEDSWERDSEKFAAIIAEAKEFIDFLDGKYSTAEDYQFVDEEKGFGMGTKGENDDEEVCVLSPSEWDMLPNCQKGGGAKSSKGTPEEKMEQCMSRDYGGRFQKTIESELDCELTETEIGEEPEDNSFMDSEPKYCKNHQELINLHIGQNEQPQRLKVMETLKLFEEQYVKLLKGRASELKEGKIPKFSYPHVEAAERVKKMGKSINIEKPFGHIPGIEIGDEFRFRAELAIVGLNRQFVQGIDYLDVNGKKCATSVVDAGRYENKAKGSGVLIYTGQGGNPKVDKNARDQKFERGNLALVNSKEMGFPVRVIFKRKNPMGCRAFGMSNERGFVYVYDGLYIVNDYWQEREEEQGGKLVYKFELQRLLDQPKPGSTNTRSGKPKLRKSVCVLDDVSKGKEKFPVRAVNKEDDDLPQPFTYITEIIYPDWFQRIEPVGCDCTGCCSDSQECPCVSKNGGEIPFNEKGAIIRAKPRVYECGPSCKCPPTCMNRVTQHGPSHQLEIFKTKSRGWGVRARGYISSGSFVCEYIGELLRDKEAEERVGNDEYLFDICNSGDEERVKDEGFTLDAGLYGNIGRFINHSCLPNLYAQEVFYDHDDERMPHIMFFAKKIIPYQQELTYRYNYKMGRVCDANGNVKTKDCYCGSDKCTGRMY